MSSSTIEKAIKRKLDDGDFLAHYGVLGMKWGVRKDRVGTFKSTNESPKSKKKTKRTSETQPKGTFKNTTKPNKASETPKKGSSNTLSNKPQNRSMSDAELKKIITRMQLERQYADLTRPAVAPTVKKGENAVKKLVKDVTYDVTKGALTEVGKAVLSQALKVEYNKRAGADYQLNIKDVKKALASVKG